MKQFHRRMLLMVSELTSFLFSIGATDVGSRILRGQEEWQIRMESDYPPESREKIAYLEKRLNNPEKDDGMGESLWELMGEAPSDEGDELYLVGTMIDEAQVRVDGRHVWITLHKKRPPHR